VIKVWKIEGGKMLKKLEGCHPGGDGSILCLLFSSNGTLISGGVDGTIKVWGL
jgi:WD40 repeat protein